MSHAVQVVIGKTGTDIDESVSMDYVAGYVNSPLVALSLSDSSCAMRALTSACSAW